MIQWMAGYSLKLCALLALALALSLALNFTSWYTH